MMSFMSSNESELAVHECWWSWVPRLVWALVCRGLEGVALSAQVLPCVGVPLAGRATCPRCLGALSGPGGLIGGGMGFIPRVFPACCNCLACVGASQGEDRVQDQRYMQNLG